MRLRLSLTLVALCVPAAVVGQPAAAPPAPPSPAAPGAGDFRDISGYDFPSLARTRRELQNIAAAMQLREYCADEKLDAAFVRRQLERFSRLTGRAETCRTLLDY